MKSFTLCLCSEKQRLFPKVTVSRSRALVTADAGSSLSRSINWTSKASDQKVEFSADPAASCALAEELVLNHEKRPALLPRSASSRPPIVLCHDCMHAMRNEPWRGGWEGQNAKSETVYVTALFLAISVQHFLGGLITAPSAYTFDLTSTLL